MSIQKWSHDTRMSPGYVKLLAKPPWFIGTEALHQSDTDAAIAAAQVIQITKDRVWQENGDQPFARGTNITLVRTIWNSRAELSARLWVTVSCIGTALGYPDAIVHAMTDPILHRFSVHPVRALFAYRMLLLLWGVTEQTWQKPGWYNAIRHDDDKVLTWVEHARTSFHTAMGTDPATGKDTTRMVTKDDVCRGVPDDSVGSAPRTDLGWLTEGVPASLAPVFVNQVRAASAAQLFSPGGRGPTVFSSWNKSSNPAYGYVTRRRPDVSTPEEMSQFVFEDQTQNTGGGVLMTVMAAGALNPAPSGTMTWLETGPDGAPSAEDDVDTETVLCLLIVAFSVEHGIVRTGIAPYSVDICDAVKTCPIPPTVAAPRNIRMLVPLILAGPLNGTTTPTPVKVHLDDVRGHILPDVACSEEDDADEVLERVNSHWSVEAPKGATKDLRPVPVTVTPDSRKQLSQGLSEDADVGSDEDVVQTFGGAEYRKKMMEEMFGPDTPESKPKSKPKSHRRVVRKNATRTGTGTKRDAKKGPVDSDSEAEDGERHGKRVRQRQRRVLVDDSSDSDE